MNYSLYLPGNNADEIVIYSKDIDYASHTVHRLRKTLLANIKSVAIAVCEHPTTFKHMLENGQIKIGGYQSCDGKKLIYLNFGNYNYLIPCFVDH